MEEVVHNTYCTGFQLEASRDISYSEFVGLCVDLEVKFNKYYNTDDYSFSPECITEGGIVFDNFNDEPGYKTMRLYPINHHGGGSGNLYGWIDPNIKYKWASDQGILIEKGKFLGTTLKSFRNVPEWTNAELKIFLECFSSVGLVLKELPKKSILRMLRRSKYYLSLFDL